MGWLDDLVAHAHGAIGNRELEVLYGRGVSDEQIDLFSLGHLRHGPPANLPLSEDFMEWASRGGRLDDVFVLPLTNAVGSIRGIQVRHVDRKRKGYSDFIEGNDEAILFGLGQAAPRMFDLGYAMLVEGAFDLFPLQRHVEPVFSTLHAGISALTARLLRRLVSDLWLGYDSDPAGRHACKGIEVEHGDTFKVHTITFPRVQLPNGDKAKDPSDLWEAWGDDRMAKFLRSLREDWNHG